MAHREDQVLTVGKAQEAKRAAYRRKAEEVKRAAECAQEAGTKKAFEDIAKSWRELRSSANREELIGPA